MGSNWGKNYMKYYLLSSKAVLQTVVAKKTPHLKAHDSMVYFFT